MANRTPFQRDRGLQQGRIQRADGTWVFELGHAVREDGEFAIGDFIQVEQDWVYGAQAGLARMDIYITPPRADTSGVAWELSVTINGSTVYERQLPANDAAEFQLIDVAIPLATAFTNAPPTANTMAVRLELVAA